LGDRLLKQFSHVSAAVNTTMSYSLLILPSALRICSFRNFVRLWEKLELNDV
jgi:hypothetical protein